jgi:ATP-dependent DNA ligase
MINSIFETIAADSGKHYKIDVLQSHVHNETVKRVCFMALDPFTQFHIRKIPKYMTDAVPTRTLEKALDDLSHLSSRSVTGHDGIAWLTDILETLTAEDAKVIERVIQKDLRCGASEGTVNKVWPGLIHEYPCMLASAFDQKLVDKVHFPAYVQLKLDGMRFNAIVRNGAVEFRSRNGKEIALTDATFGLPFIYMAGFYGCDMVFDGELLIADATGAVADRKTGNGILNKAVKGTMSQDEGAMVRATLWDAIPFESFEQGVDKEHYKDRFAKLSNCLSDFRKALPAVEHLINLAPTQSVANLDEAKVLFEKYLQEGQEGIILKTKNMIWENKRSKHQIKFKGELECDLKVVDWVEGTGKHVGRMGALVLESADGIVRVGVGTGFSDDDRNRITRDVIGSVVAIKYNARITDKKSNVDSLFLPVFLCIRVDKDYADTSELIK